MTVGTSDKDGGSTAPNRALTRRKRKARSAVTNGSIALAGVDGRSARVRRYKDVLAALVSGLGGESQISEGQLSRFTVFAERWILLWV